VTGRLAARTGGEVRHDRAAQRFVVVVEGEEAELTYSQGDGVIVVTHTGVPPRIAGRGVAADLVRAALEFARAEDLKVIPACSYVAAYFKRHPQEADLLAT
jgi:predicted GNAT family acetyltransferase